MNYRMKLVLKLSEAKILIPVFILFVVLLIMVNSFLKPDFTYLTQTLNYTPEAAYSLLSKIGAGGRQTHMQVLIADLVMVILYSAFLAGLNYRIFSSFVKNCAVISFITFLPVVLGVIQILEIITLSVIIGLFPLQFTVLTQIANVITLVKSMLTIICFTLPIPGLIAMIIIKTYRKIRDRDRGEIRG